MFAGSPEVGRAGIAFLESQTDYDSNSGGFEIDTSVYAIDLDWYWKNFTIGAFRGFHKSSANKPSVIIDEEADSSLLSVAYYYNSNAKIELSRGGMDMENVNAISMEILPEVLGKKISIGIGYTDMPEDHATNLSLKYYFTDSVSLIDRSRRY